MPSPSSRNYEQIANQYVDDVLNGKAIAGKWVKLACQRQKNDLARQGTDSFPYTYDPAIGTKACRFIELCPHVEGRKFAGKKIKLEPWQVFFYLTFTSWKTLDGDARFRRGYMSVGKGNGKSTAAAPFAIYKAFADTEPGSQVYSAAVSKDQAKIIWNAARQMLLNMEPFVNRAGIEIEKHSLYQPKTNSVFKPLAADDRTSEGKNPYLVIVDELHAHPDRNFYDSLDTATGKRQGAQLLVVTTRGSDLKGVCYELDLELQKTLEGVMPMDELFGCIYCPDKDDDPMSEIAWIKANPNWGVSVDPKKIKDKAEAALVTPSQRPSFMTKHCNLWVKSDQTWMDMMRFLACSDPNLQEGDFADCDCVVGLDLASKLDILAGMKVFYRTVDAKRHYYAFGTYWLPQEQIDKKENNHYRGWQTQGIVQGCTGGTNDYDAVEDWIRETCKKYKVQEVTHDQYQAVEITNHLLEEGVPMTEFAQKAIHYTGPMDELEAAVMDKRFHYNGDPVLAWAISNVVCHRDRNEMLFPTKDVRENKIDPAVALCMAVGRILLIAGTVKSSGGGTVTLIGNCRCSALAIGEIQGDKLVYLCDRCKQQPH